MVRQIGNLNFDEFLKAKMTYSFTRFFFFAFVLGFQTPCGQNWYTDFQIDGKHPLFQDVFTPGKQIYHPQKVMFIKHKSFLG